LLLLQVVLFRAGPGRAPAGIAFPTLGPAATATPTTPVGRDPFADPFGAAGKGDKSGSVLVKPPGVIRDGDQVTAAATVVNQDDGKWLPPSELTFVARDANGHIIARATATVSLGPGKAETVVAPDLGVEPSAIAAIEAHIQPAEMRSGAYPSPSVTVAGAAVAQDGHAITGTLSIGPRAGDRATLACALFDPLDELAGVGTKTIDLHAADRGRLSFELTAQPVSAGPYRVACSISATATSG